MDDWRTRYTEYINSDKWKNIKRGMLELRGNKCERCGVVWSVVVCIYIIKLMSV